MVEISILLGMKLMTVREYAEYIGKSVPLVYKQIKQNKVKTVSKFGLILIKAEWNYPPSSPPTATVTPSAPSMSV